jgi:hypothetical protein
MNAMDKLVFTGFVVIQSAILLVLLIVLVIALFEGFTGRKKDREGKL